VSKLTVVPVGLLSTLVLAGAALAANPTVSGYGGQAGGVESDVQAGGTLPFTGLDLGLIIGGGILLLLLGAGLRRLTRERPHSL